jgi:hypothetical protein
MNGDKINWSQHALLKLGLFFLFVSSVFMFSATPAMALSSPILGDMSLTTSACGTSLLSGYGTAFIAGSSTSISETDVLVENVAGTTFPNGQPLSIAFYTGGSGKAGTLIGYETQTAASIADTYGHTSSYSDVQLYGNISFTAGQTYSWEYVTTNTNYSPCYNNNSSSNNYGNTGWSVYSYVLNSNPGSTNDSFAFVFGTNNSATSISLTSADNGNGYQFGRNASIVATVTGSDGTVTFYFNNKKIFHCVNLQTTSLTVTCTWKVDTHGLAVVTASFVPSASGYTNSVSSPLYLTTKKRTATYGT